MDPRYAGHVTPEGHPERPARIERIVRLADGLQSVGASLFESARVATAEELARVHTRDHIDRMADTAGRSHVMVRPGE